MRQNNEAASWSQSFIAALLIENVGNPPSPEQKINQEETKTHKSRQTHTDRRQNIEVLFSTGGRATTTDDTTRSALHFDLLEMK